MLNFAEHILKEIRKLRQSSEEMVLHGAIQDMERYRFVMGRLEALKLVEESVKELLKRRTEDQF